MKRNEDLSDSLQLIGNRLLQLRMEGKHKLITISQGVGCDPSVISRIEHGIYHSLSFALLQQFSAYYGLTLCELLKEVFANPIDNTK